MENHILIKSRIPPAQPVLPGPFDGESEFKPIGVAAALVVDGLARRLDSNRAHADLQNGGSE